MARCRAELSVPRPHQGGFQNTYAQRGAVASNPMLDSTVVRRMFRAKQDLQFVRFREYIYTLIETLRTISAGAIRGRNSEQLNLVSGLHESVGAERRNHNQA